MAVVEPDLGLDQLALEGGLLAVEHGATGGGRDQAQHVGHVGVAVQRHFLELFGLRPLARGLGELGQHRAFGHQLAQVEQDEAGTDQDQDEDRVIDLRMRVGSEGIEDRIAEEDRPEHQHRERQRGEEVVDLEFVVHGVGFDASVGWMFGSVERPVSADR